MHARPAPSGYLLGRPRTTRSLTTVFVSSNGSWSTSGTTMLLRRIRPDLTDTWHYFIVGLRDNPWQVPKSVTVTLFALPVGSGLGDDNCFVIQTSTLNSRMDDARRICLLRYASTQGSMNCLSFQSCLFLVSFCLARYPSPVHWGVYVSRNGVASTHARRVEFTHAHRVGLTQVVHCAYRP